MATVSTPATLSSVKTVFGGGGSLLAYLRGGSNVKNFPNAYSTIATTAPLTLSSFAGKVNPTYSLSNTGIALENMAISTNNARAEYLMRANGQRTTIGTGTNNNTWLLAGQAADFEIIYTKTSGSTPAGSAVNTWLNLSTTCNWSITESRDGFFSTTGSGTVQVRMASSPQTVLQSFALTLTAVVEV